MGKPILCLAFDGVVHSYESGWKGAGVVPDAPVPGAMKFIWDAAENFRVAIFSSRSNQIGGLDAMKAWLSGHLHEVMNGADAQILFAQIEWPTEKPAAFVTIDDRALTFDGSWPSIESLTSFKPWNKK
jgi:hypothetical protein